MAAGSVAALVAGLGFGWTGSPEVQAQVPDTLQGVDVRTSTVDAHASAVDVPFVAQGSLLCGGAAAAMVERFWGAHGVYGEDFQHLVQADEGGIRAAELSAAMQERGYIATPVTNEPDVAFGALAIGIPPILLLESGVTRLHYVVLVGLEGDDAWIHDPNFGPHRHMSREELLDEWSASGYWALLVTPTGTEAPSGGRGAAERGAGTDGVAAGASDPAVAEAMARLRHDDPSGARAAVRPLVDRGGPESVVARRILATGWFIEGDPMKALAEWNILGEPTIDLVRIEGARATRHHVTADRISLEHRDMLTPSSLALAERRLAQLPAVQASLLAYRPLPDGTVEVVASVLERPRLPGAGTLSTQGARAVVSRRAGLEVGPLMAAGDRWRVAGSWEVAQRYVGASVSTPAAPLPGIATVGVEWRRERFADGTDVVAGVLTEKRRRGWLGLEEWIHPRVRLGARIALESWHVPSWGGDPDPQAPDRLVNGGATVHWTTLDDASWMTVEGDVWSGAAATFGRASVQTGATLPQGAHREWILRAGGTVASRAAPRTLWPGADASRVRGALLRAHDLVEDGAIRGPVFGRELVHGTVEHRLFRRAGPLRAGVAVFADAAHVWSRPGAAAPRGFLDVGAGLFVGLGSQEGAVSLARGSSGWKLSARVGG